MTMSAVKRSPKSPPLPLWRGGRPVQPSPVGTSLTFLARGLIKLRRAPEQAADAVLIPIIFTVVFTYLFGGALAGSTSKLPAACCPAPWS
jgi:ABC-2 type transport system permease protein